MACHMVANAGTIAQILLALFALLADVASAWGRYPSEAVRIRPNFLPPVGRVIVQDGKPASVTLEPIDLSVRNACCFLQQFIPVYPLIDIHISPWTQKTLLVMLLLFGLFGSSTSQLTRAQYCALVLALTQIMNRVQIVNMGSLLC